MNKPQRPNVLTVHEHNRLIEEQDENAHGMNVREWNRLQREEPINITDDAQIGIHCVLVFDPRKAWRLMKDSRYACISIRTNYKGKHAYLFRIHVENDLPW